MEKMYEDIQERRLCLVVMGSGYVGLPTAAQFADTGFNVIALDIKPEIVEAVNSGISPFDEPGLMELVSGNVQAGRLSATLDSSSALNQAEAIIVSIQTPIYENKEPNLSILWEAIKEISVTLKKGSILVICSTLPPGTMLGEIKPMLESKTGFKTDTDFYLAYVPERIAPGKAIQEFVENTRLVGGIGPNSTKVAARLFSTVCKNIIETDASSAEVAKLAENTFRDLNIGFANQLALMCENLVVDISEVIKLANTHARVNIHMPGPGVGGPCLPKDPYLLLHPFKTLDYDLITTARKINDYMPHHIVELVTKAFDIIDKDMENSIITVFGTAYKGNVDDSRLSPSQSIITELLKLSLEVLVYDPYCAESFGARKVKTFKEAVKDSDCLVIATDHSIFKDLDLKKIKNHMKENPILIDGKRIINPLRAKKLGFTYLGIGIDMRVT